MRFTKKIIILGLLFTPFFVQAIGALPPIISTYTNSINSNQTTVTVSILGRLGTSSGKCWPPTQDAGGGIWTEASDLSPRAVAVTGGLVVSMPVTVSIYDVAGDCPSTNGTFTGTRGYDVSGYENNNYTTKGTVDDELGQSRYKSASFSINNRKGTIAVTSRYSTGGNAPTGWTINVNTSKPWCAGLPTSYSTSNSQGANYTNAHSNCTWTISGITAKSGFIMTVNGRTNSASDNLTNGDTINFDIVYTPNGSPTPTPGSTNPPPIGTAPPANAPVCSPSNQNVTQGEQAILSSNINGNWSTSGADINSKSNTTDFRPTYSGPGTKTVTVSNAYGQTQCTVDVEAPAKDVQLDLSTDPITASVSAGTYKNSVRLTSTLSGADNVLVESVRWKFKCINDGISDNWDTIEPPYYDGVVSRYMDVTPPGSTPTYTTPLDYCDFPNEQGTGYLSPGSYDVRARGRARFSDNSQSITYKGKATFIVGTPTPTPTPTPINPPTNVKVSLNYCASTPEGQTMVSWTYNGGGNQTAYQVQVNSGGNFNGCPDNQDGSGTCEYNSGKVLSSCNPGSTCIAPVNKILSYNTTMDVRVRTWDENGNASAFTSMTACEELGYFTGLICQINNKYKTPKHAYPDSDFTWTPYPYPITGNPVQFLDQSLAFGGASIVSPWSWTFGDGGVSTEQNPKHTYLQAESYNVRLIAKDSTGYICDTTKTINVKPRIPKWYEVLPQ